MQRGRKEIGREQNKKKGAWAEQAASWYLRSMNYQIIDRNYRCRQGEIDIIAQDGAVLVFVEVKFRKNTEYGYPAEAVDLKKQRKICLTAKYYIYCHNINTEQSIRFDIVEILGNQIRLIKNAYDYHI